MKLSYSLLVAIRDPTSFEVVWSQFNLDAIARQDPDVVHAHLSGNVRQNFVAVLEFDPKHGVGERLDNCPLQYDCVFFSFCDWNFLLREFDQAHVRAQDQRINLPGVTESTNWEEKQSRRPFGAELPRISFAEQHGQPFPTLKP